MEAAVLASIGEAIHEQEIQHLVIPGRRRRVVGATARQRGQIDVAEAGLDLIVQTRLVSGHCFSVILYSSRSRCAVLRS